MLYKNQWIHWCKNVTQYLSSVELIYPSVHVRVSRKIGNVPQNLYLTK